MSQSSEDDSSLVHNMQSSDKFNLSSGSFGTRINQSLSSKTHFSRVSQSSDDISIIYDSRNPDMFDLSELDFNKSRSSLTPTIACTEVSSYYEQI